MPPTLDLDAGATWRLAFVAKNPDGSPRDLTCAECFAEIRAAPGLPVVATPVVTLTDAATGAGRLELARVPNAPGYYFVDVLMRRPAGPAGDAERILPTTPIRVLGGVTEEPAGVAP